MKERHLPPKLPPVTDFILRAFYTSGVFTSGGFLTFSFGPDSQKKARFPGFALVRAPLFCGFIRAGFHKNGPFYKYHRGGERSYHRCGLAALQKDGSKTVDFMSPTAFSANSSRNTYFSVSRQPAKMSSLTSLVENALLELLPTRSFKFSLNTTF